LRDLQPAGLIVGVLAIVALTASMTKPIVGPCVSLGGLVLLTGWVATRVFHADPAPTGLVYAALFAAIVTCAAVYRLGRTIRARSHSDLTVGDVLPTSVAVVALWFCVALTESGIALSCPRPAPARPASPPSRPRRPGACRPRSRPPRRPRRRTARPHAPGAAGTRRRTAARSWSR